MANGRERLGPNVPSYGTNEHGGARRRRPPVTKPFKVSPVRDPKLKVKKPSDVATPKKFNEKAFRRDWMAKNPAPSQYARDPDEKAIQKYEAAMADYNARWATGEYARRDELGPRPQDPRGAKKMDEWYDYDVKQWNVSYKADLQKEVNRLAEKDLKVQERAYKQEQKDYKEAQRRTIVGSGSSYGMGGYRGFEMLGRRFV